MSMQYIRDYYRVPAKRGGRVRFSGFEGGWAQDGTIVGSRDQYLRVSFDGAAPVTLHPTWEVYYYDSPESDVSES